LKIKGLQVVSKTCNPSFFYDGDKRPLQHGSQIKGDLCEGMNINGDKLVNVKMRRKVLDNKGLGGTWWDVVA